MITMPWKAVIEHSRGCEKLETHSREALDQELHHSFLWHQGRANQNKGESHTGETKLNY